MSREFYVRVVVHANVPAESAREALALLCGRLRDGLGPDTGDREWGLAIVAADVEGEIMLLNEEFVRRAREERGRPRHPTPNGGEEAR